MTRWCHSELLKAESSLKRPMMLSEPIFPQCCRRSVRVAKIYRDGAAFRGHQHDRLGATVARCGKQFERAAACYLREHEKRAEFSSTTLADFERHGIPKSVFL